MTMTEAEASAPPASALQIRQQHQRLVARNLDGATREERAAFIAAVQAAGEATPPGRDRDGLQTILFFWSGEQAARKERDRSDPMPELAPYVGPRASVAAEAELPMAAPATADAGGATARTTDLPTQAAPPPPPSPLPSPSATVSATIRDLARKIGGAKPPAPAAVRPPPPPSDDEVNARARAILQIAAVARRWRLSNFAKGYLLSGAALVEAEQYAEDDPEIRSLVEASRQADSKYRRALFWSLASAGIAVLAIAYGFYRTWHESVVLEESAIAREKERAELRITVSNALDALSRGEVSPLRSFLQRYATDPVSLERLQLGPQSTATPESDIVATPKRASPPDKTSPPTTDAASCTGYLWFGSSKEDSRLTDRRDPSTLRAGETVTLDNRDDIRLREQLPTPTYTVGRQNGLVPAGATVRVTSAPVPYQRTNATQYWAQVSVPRAYCTNVFLQYVGTDQQRDTALNALRAINVQTPPAERLASAKGLAEVRYFFTEDKPVAEQIAAELARFNNGSRLRVVALIDFPTKPSPGTVEVWLDLNR